jgi:hypothetical protein
LADVLTFGLRVGSLEFFWTAESKLVAVKGIESWEQARSFIEHFVGQGAVQVAAFPQTTVPPLNQPQTAARPNLTVVPPPAAQPQPQPQATPPAPAQQAQPQSSAGAQGQLPIAPQPEKPAAPPAQQAPAPQPANPPLAEDAVFTRATTVGDVVDEIVRRNPAATTTKEVAALARKLMESVHVPALVSVAAEDFDDRVESVAVGALIMAGSR